MANTRINSFPPEVIQELKTYIYRLIDSRNGETFYVGKGQGNRVFAHVRAEENLEGDDLDNKILRIRQIRVAGLEVGHVIHRHGLDDRTALEVEAALIDAYPGLTNEASGLGADQFGAMHAVEIVQQYAAEEADIQHKALLISINRTATERPMYEATRFAWKVNPQKAAQADVILSVRRGLIIGAFVADTWLPATATNFPGREDSLGRFGFVGHEAPSDIRSLYIGKRVPDKYRRRGAANPIKYTWA